MTEIYRHPDAVNPSDNDKAGQTARVGTLNPLTMVSLVRIVKPNEVERARRLLPSIARLVSGGSEVDSDGQALDRRASLEAGMAAVRFGLLMGSQVDLRSPEEQTAATDPDTGHLKDPNWPKIAQLSESDAQNRLRTWQTAFYQMVDMGADDPQSNLELV